ncbi:mucin 3 intestinal [Cricetulus griseus]
MGLQGIPAGRERRSSGRPGEHPQHSSVTSREQGRTALEKVGPGRHQCRVEPRPDVRFSSLQTATSPLPPPPPQPVPGEPGHCMPGNASAGQLIRLGSVSDSMTLSPALRSRQWGEEREAEELKGEIIPVFMPGRAESPLCGSLEPWLRAHTRGSVLMALRCGSGSVPACCTHIAAAQLPLAPGGSPGKQIDKPMATVTTMVPVTSIWSVTSSMTSVSTVTNVGSGSAIVLLKLSFSPQLRSKYEKVKMTLKAELQSSSQDGDSVRTMGCLGAMFSGETQGLPALRLEGRGGEWGSPDTAAFAHLCDLLNCHLGPGPRKWIEIWDEEIVGTFSKLGFQDSPTDAKLCYNANFTTVDMETLKFSFNPVELCNQKAAADFGQYFYPEVVEGRLTCVNNCTRGTKSQLNCNLGQCQLLRSGPHCVAKYDPSQAWQREALPGTFKSTGVWEGQNLKEDNFGPEKGYSHFQPNLQPVDPNTEAENGNRSLCSLAQSGWPPPLVIREAAGLTPIHIDPLALSDRVPVVICQNGGSWDGLKCQCTSLFYGPRCEDVVESFEIEKTVTAAVEVSVTVTSQNYSEKLEDPKSEEFKKFNKTFTEQVILGEARPRAIQSPTRTLHHSHWRGQEEAEHMKMIYAEIPEYEGVVIKSLRKGSIVVDYDVILKTRYTPEYETVFQSISSNMKEKIENATKLQVTVNNNCSALLCFNSTATKVQNVSNFVISNETCQQQVGEEYAKYVFTETKGDKVHCITACSAGYKTSLDCHYGKCQLQRSGPQCLCLTTDTHWYSGETCDWGIQKSLVYGLVGAAVAVLLVILVILGVLSTRFRREANRQKFKVSQMQKWNEEEGRNPGAFHNVGFDHNEEGENYVHLGSMYSNFEASLSHINPEEKIQIQRPEIVMTSL